MGQENQKPNQKPKRGGLTADLIAGLSAIPCVSQPAGDERPDNAILQTGRVIVDVHREQASLLQGYVLTQVGFKAASLLFLIVGAPLNHDGRTQALRSG
jgi:hypothetical protein